MIQNPPTTITNCKMCYPIQQRNVQLKTFFKSFGFEVKLIGDYNQPIIVINDDYAVSGFVQNRLYHFTTKPFGGNIVRTVNLNEPDLTKSDLDDILSSNEQKRFWRLSVKCKNNLIYYLKTERGIPLFANNDSRYWFKYDRVIEYKKYLAESFNIETDIVTSKLNL